MIRKHRKAAACPFLTTIIPLILAKCGLVSIFIREMYQFLHV